MFMHFDLDNSYLICMREYSGGWSRWAIDVYSSFAGHYRYDVELVMGVIIHPIGLNNASDLLHLHTPGYRLVISKCVEIRQGTVLCLIWDAHFR